LVSDITERRRAEEGLREQASELARSNALLAALGQVAARLQTNLHPDQVMEALGAELRGLGIHSVVSLLDVEGETAVVRYLSLGSSVMANVAKVLGREIAGLRVSSLPFEEELVAGGQAVYVPSVLPTIATALPDIPKPVLKRALEIGGMSPDDPAFHLPLAVEGRVFGVLTVIGGDLREQDLPAVTVFASQAAIAIENARLYHAELTAREQLGDLASYLQDAREGERKRIAREIHDELGQTLTALQFDLSQLAKRLPAAEPSLREKAEGMASLIDGSMRTVRRVTTELRPGLLDDLGLAAAIEWQAGEFGERTGAACDLSLRGEDAVLPPDVATALFRILQEALTNVARHAGASHVTIELEVDPDQVRLIVGDDGRGITSSQASDPRALGLLGMRERARALGGDVTIERARGGGTSVTVRVPRGDE
jgi:signal transduction histidine kinase